MKPLIVITVILLTRFSVTAQEPLEEKEIGFGPVERVPVYPGCDSLKSQYQLKECMNEKISDLISHNFNRKIADSLGLPNEIVKIKTKFMIDTLGFVRIIKITAPHSDLEKETRRVIQLIPRMSKPATQRLIPVNIYNTLPIYFKVGN